MQFRLPRVTAGHAAVLIATAALFVAVDGPSQAGALITGKDVKNSSLTGKDIKDRSLTGADVKDDSLTGADVSEATLGKVPSATSADGVAANSITGASVADGSLTASDISAGHGRITVDLPSTAANQCTYTPVTLQGGIDFGKAAILVTPAFSLGSLDVSITTTHSDSVGLARMVLCNPTAAAVNPPSATFDWIAFNVAP